MMDTSYKTNRGPDSSILESERINKLRQRVTTVHKKLHQIEHVEKSTKKLYSLIDTLESPVKFTKDISNQSVNFSTYKPMMGDLENTENSTMLSFTKHNILDDSATLNLSQINPTNERTKILKDILVKMDMYKVNSPNTQKILNYFLQKIEANKPYYYNFMKENNTLTLKVLIQILYEEIESLVTLTEHNDVAHNAYVENIEKKLEEKTLLCDKFTEEIIEKNLEIESLRNRLGDRETSSKFSLFFVELRVLLQNIMDEIINARIITEDQKISYKHLITSTLSQISKLESDSQNPEASVHQDMPRLFKMEDRNSLLMMQHNILKKSTENIHPNLVEVSNQVKKDKEYRQIISNLENENKRLKEELEELNKINEEPRNNSQLLLSELRRVMGDKEKLEEECKRLRQAYHESREEFANISSQILKNTTERDAKSQSYMQENEELKKKLQQALDDLRNKENNFKIEMHKMELELNNAREKIVSLLEQKSAAERELLQLNVEKKDMFNKTNVIDTKIMEITAERDLALSNLEALEKLLQQRSTELEKVTREKTELQSELTALKEKEARLSQEVQELSKLQSELQETKDILRDAHDQILRLEEENKQYEYRFKNPENITGNKATSYVLEQMAMIILSKNNKKLDEETRNKIQAFLGDNFIHVLEPLQAKLKTYEAYKNKYQEKIVRHIGKLDDIKWLCGIILQAIEVMSRSYNNQIPATLIMLKEELEQKKNAISQKVKEANVELEADKLELKNLSQEEGALQNLYADMELLSPKVNEGELHRLKEENENLKNKLQTQNYEIQSLKSQLKLATTLEETKRQSLNMKNASEMPRSSRGTRRELHKSKTFVTYDDEEDTVRVVNEICTQNDLLLMLHSQASSLEMMINNEYN